MDAMDKISTDHSKPTSSHAASATAAAPTAEANAANGTHKHSNEFSAVDNDSHIEVNAEPTLTKRKLQVRKSPSPLRTRSGLTRLPGKRTRAIAMPARKKSIVTESHATRLASPKLINAPQRHTSVTTSSQISASTVDQADNIAARFSALSFQHPKTNNKATSLVGTMPMHSCLFPNASSTTVEFQQNAGTKNNLSTNNQRMPNSLPPSAFQLNSNSLFSACSQNNTQPTSTNTMFNSNANQRGLYMNAPSITIPPSQTSNSFSSWPVQTAPYLVSAPFTYDYQNSFAPYSSHVNNPSVSQQHSSLHAPTSMYNSIMPSSIGYQSNSNNITADLSLSTSQIAARHAISKDLPNFNGNPEEWPMFITNYVQSTERCGFTEQENLIRLQKCLKGPALEAVRGKLMMPATVNFAVETLRMLYGRAEIIHITLQKKLREQPPVRKEKLDTLIHFALAVQNYRTTMQAMGLADYLKDPILLNDLVGKLPCDLKLDWGRYRFTLPGADISVFDGWLYNLATCAAHVTSFVPTHDGSKGSTKERLNLHDVVDKAIEKNTEVTVSCLKCSQSHRLADCPEFLLLTTNQRWNFIRENNLCIRCFKKHSLRRCYSKKQCGVDDCIKPHNPLLHNMNQQQLQPNNNNQSDAQHQNAEANSSIFFHTKENKSLFRYVPVTLFGKTHSLNTFALIDEGSSCTLIENDLASELGLDGPREELCLQWTGDVTQRDENSRVVSFQLTPRDQIENKMILRNVRTIENLDLPVQTLTREEISLCKHLQNLPILAYTSVKARLLIGIDNAKLCVPLEIKEGTSDGLIATRCRIGWGVYGRQYADSSSIRRVMHVCPCGTDDRMDELLQHYFSLDSVGVKLNLNPLRSKEDECAKIIMESTTKHIAEEKVWETGLLWKYENPCLPDSFPMARRRLFCLEAKMNKDPLLKSFLVEKMQDYERKGYIKKLQPNEISSGGKSWYIPIFTITNKNKNKTRIVWDAAAAVENISLNSVLLKGPDLLKSVIGVWLRFRERPIAISGDIREMFHQIRVAKGDQCAQQFLWRGGDISKKIDVYAMTVMTFGASCSPSLANFIKNKNAERFAAEFPDAVHAILNNTFVDDWLQSLDSEDEMISMAKTVRTIHSEGGFEMRNWLSNSKYVIEALEYPNVEAEKFFEDPEGKFEKVLGMWWTPATDELSFFGKFGPEVFDERVIPTKRSVLRTIMTIFDPLGLLGHFLIYAKIVLQEIWRSGVGWDEPIFERESEKWWSWLNLVPSIPNIRIPRCHQNLSRSSNVQLHTFVDASIDAYAAVVYMRIECEGEIKCSLVASKTRVAPLKPISIPRLELMAAVTGLRLANFIINELSVKIHRKVFWSDSKDVLYWIRSDARKFQQFVALRIGEILEGSQIKQWRWVPSFLNVADDATKWNSVPNLSFETRWFSGPSFLSSDETEWPISEFTDAPDANTERVCLIDLRKPKPTFPLLTIVPDPERYSRWEKLRFSQRRVFQYIHILMGSQRLKSEFKPFIDEQGIDTVELFIFKACQEDTYYEEITALKSNKGVSRKSVLYKCSPYLDELGVLRMRGRIDAIPNVSIGVKRPIILPQRHRITRLLIDFYHRKYHHHHNEIVVNEIRQLYWINGLRAAVRTISKDCQLCKIRRAIPSAPKMGDLPMERLSSFTRPFHFTGVDYFGPLDVVIGRRKEKRWGVLFTCMTVRAVHIEISPSLSTDSFLMVLKQFMSRRGVPRRIYSDNATNFRGACRVLTDEIEKISTNELERKYPQIEWTFIPPASPHMGGSWERMVRSVKSVLMDILPKEGLREEVLRSALADVEHILNSRPLTYVPLETSACEALTPNHFLIGSSSGMRERATPNGTGSALSKNYRISSMIADTFWKRWVREILPCLARRTKWYGDSTSPIAINDVVIIVDEHTKRNTWTKGIVVDVNRGKDNVVRSAVVKTETGLCTRPAVKLAKLDIRK